MQCVLDLENTCTTNRYSFCFPSDRLCTPKVTPDQSILYKNITDPRASSPSQYVTGIELWTSQKHLISYCDGRVLIPRFKVAAPNFKFLFIFDEWHLNSLCCNLWDRTALCWQWSVKDCCRCEVCVDHSEEKCQCDVHRFSVMQRSM